MPGYDLMVQAVSGLMSLTGDPDGPPYRAGISVFDVMAGNHAVIGILAALRHREATGQGQHVEVNLLSSALSGLVNHSSAYVAGGVVPYRMGNAHPSVFPYEPLPTADRDLIIAAANDRLFRKLCEVLGIPEVADDPRFARNRDRTVNRAELKPILVERLATRSADEWFDLLVAAGVPCGPINTIDGGFAMAEQFALDPVVTVGEGERAVPMARHPITFSATPARYALPPPELDEHGAELRRGSRTGAVVVNEYPTALGASSRDAITLLGHDLARDVMGEVGFGELAFWLATQRRPEPGEVRVFEAVLAALADHGFTPTAIVTRLTYLSAPDSIQGALAAGLLGTGSRFLGVTEDTGRFLHDVLDRSTELPTDDAGWDALALRTVTAQRAAGRFVPGLGHHVHKDGDPRTPRLMQIAREEGLFGPHLALFAAIGRVHPQVLGKTLPLNGAGVCGAALADLGLPLPLLRGFALLARTAGLIGQLAEELRHPVANEIFLSVDLHNRSVAPDPWTSET